LLDEGGCDGPPGCPVLVSCIGQLGRNLVQWGLGLPVSSGLADRLREQTGVELTVEEILDSPHVFIGSIKDLTRKFVDLRERFGISSFLVDDLDALAPVVEDLAGR
jgi:hypothetical protein